MLILNVSALFSTFQTLTHTRSTGSICSQASPNTLTLFQQTFDPHSTLQHSFQQPLSHTHTQARSTSAASSLYSTPQYYFNTLKSPSLSISTPLTLSSLPQHLRKTPSRHFLKPSALFSHSPGSYSTPSQPLS